MAIFGWIIVLIAAIGITIYGFCLVMLSSAFGSKETGFIFVMWVIMSSALWFATYIGMPFTISMN